MIQRYDLSPDHIQQDDYGQWVRWRDHQRLVTSLEARIEALSRQLRQHQVDVRYPWTEEIYSD
jgi:hypothetical protein